MLNKQNEKRKETLNGTRPEIIYFGQPFEFLKTSSRPNEDLIFLREPASVLEFLKNPRAAVLMAVTDEMTFTSAIEILEKFEAESPGTTRILVVQNLSMDIFKTAVNRLHVHFCLDIADFRKRWKEILDQAMDLYGRANDKALLLRESTRQFRELEALNSSLEKIVFERTQHIQTSKEDEEEKLNKVRSLIRFIKELAQTSSFEELLILVRKEVRKFHKVGDPVLVRRASQGKVEFISFQSGQVLFTAKGGDFPFSDEILISGNDMLLSLANHFGRPFVKAIYVPLEMKESSVHGAQAGLCLEANLNEEELDLFLDFIRERAQSIAITVDRLTLENELVQFSYRWERTFDGFRDPIAIIDVDHEILRSNKKFNEKASRRKCFETFGKQARVCEGCPIQEAIAAGAPRKGQIQAEGRLFEVHSYPISFDNNPRVTNVVNQYVDITQSRELYLKLLQSEKMGAIGLLAGNIAHELNNPLTGLRSLAQVLMQQAKDGNLLSDLQEIEKATERSQKIIRNLLDFSWGGPQTVRLTSLDEVVAKTIPMLKAAMRSHRQEFDFNAPNAEILVEPHLIQQVVFNLINNACQAMKDPGILTVRTFQDDEKVTLQVGDTGPGVPESLREKIFEPFFTTKKEGLGTGLGLSLTRKIVESYGGRVLLLPTAQGGAVFEVSLPIARVRT